MPHQCGIPYLYFSTLLNRFSKARAHEALTPSRSRGTEAANAAQYRGTSTGGTGSNGNTDTETETRRRDTEATQGDRGRGTAVRSTAEYKIPETQMAQAQGTGSRGTRHVWTVVLMAFVFVPCTAQPYWSEQCSTFPGDPRWEGRSAWRGPWASFAVSVGHPMRSTMACVARAGCPSHAHPPISTESLWHCHLQAPCAVSNAPILRSSGQPSLMMTEKMTPVTGFGGLGSISSRAPAEAGARRWRLLQLQARSSTQGLEQLEFATTRFRWACPVRLPMAEQKKQTTAAQKPGNATAESLLEQFKTKLPQVREGGKADGSGSAAASAAEEPDSPETCWCLFYQL